MKKDKKERSILPGVIIVSLLVASLPSRERGLKLYTKRRQL